MSVRDIILLKVFSMGAVVAQTFYVWLFGTVERCSPKSGKSSALLIMR